MSVAPGPYLTFRIGPSVFALPACEVAEILPLAELDRPAGSPAILAGFLNLGGAPLPVVELAAVLDVGAQADPQDVYRHILKLEAADLGLLVDRVLDMVAEAQDAAPAAPDESVNGAVSARLTVAGELVSLLDAGALLLREEALRLEELAEAARGRIADAVSPG